MNFLIKFLFLHVISAIPAGGKDMADLRVRESGNRTFGETFGSVAVHFRFLIL